MFGSYPGHAKLISFWRELPSQRFRAPDVVQAKKLRKPLDGFWIVLAVQDKFLTTPNSVQQDGVPIQFPAMQAAMVTQSRCIFMGVKPIWQLPNASRFIWSC